MSVANQKIVRIGKRVARDPTHLYAKINIDAMQYAYATLNRSGLGLWLYFNKNQDDYQFELSQKACAEWGIKKDSYYNGVNELIRFGFLVPISEGSNIYTFYETPLSEIANSHSPKSFSVSPQSMSKKQNDFSEKQERNITNITLKEQDITINDFYKPKDKKFKSKTYDYDSYPVCNPNNLPPEFKALGF